MLQAPVRTMGMVIATGMLMASFASAEDPAAKSTTSKAATPATTPATTPAKPATTPAKPATTPAADEVAVLETSRGRMVIEFWEKDAPQTVANFKKLSRQGFYDGTGFHRIIKGFMIQGGDPKSKNPKATDLGTGGPGTTIKDEFNNHKHVAGVISMAHSGSPNSGGSQFFIMDGPNSGLDGKYTAFGHLIEGMSVLKEIANSPVGPSLMMQGEHSRPLEWTTLKSVKIMPRSAALAKAPAAAAKTGAATATKPATKTTTTTTTKAAETPAKEAADQAAGEAKEPVKEVAKESAPADSAQGQKQ